MQIEREDTYLRFIRWSHHSQRRLAGEKKKRGGKKKKKYPIDRYNNLSSMNTNGNAGARNSLTVLPFAENTRYILAGIERAL